MRTALRLSRVSTAVFTLAAGATLVVASASGIGTRDSSAQAVTPQRAAVACEMKFTMTGWSAIVSKAKGKGVVTCDNGQTANVALEIKGGGLTFGTTQIDEGKGVFTGVTDISEVFGSYAQAQASSGAVQSKSAEALTKGGVSLAITTKGRGWTLGVSGSSFSIEREAA
jgi:hypothetical protein